MTFSDDANKELKPLGKFPLQTLNQLVIIQKQRVFKVYLNGELRGV